MYATVQVPKRSLNDQRSHVGEEVIQQLRLLARPLRGARVLNLTVSPFGTVVSDLLSAVVPMLRELGIEAEWQFVAGDAELNQAARKVYDGLSGRPVEWDQQSVWRWLLYNRLNSAHFDDSYDVVVIHEPQPTALLPVLVEQGRDLGKSRWVWHCHLDLRRARPEIWETVRPILEHYDACVFSHPGFAPPDAVVPRLVVIPPAIDPASKQNAELSQTAVRKLLGPQGVEVSRPIVTQVGQFTESFSPMKAIDAVRLARAERPDIQLVLIQPSVEPNPEAWARFEEVARYASRDGAIRTIAAQGDTGSMLVNAAQRAASVVMQASVPAGFAPHLWEAMWKRRPVVAGVSGGLPLQVEDGVTGVLAEDAEGLARAILQFVANPELGDHLATEAREVVRRHHLLTGFLESELHLFRALLSPNPRPMAARKEAIASA